ncbi:MAG: putative bifunctional diguanylate cyclase/phosphodiesterase [Candidatus Xenobia bacterium]
MIKVLYLEDDKVDQMAFKRLIKAEGLDFDVTYGGSCSEGLRLLQDGRFDVVIADYLLGDGNALDVLKARGNTPVIIVTGVGDEEIAVGAMKAGAVDYLIKDQDRNYLKVLPLTVDHAISRSRMQEQNVLLSAAMKSIGDSVYIVSPDNIILFVNRAFCDTYGYLEDHIVGQQAALLWERPSEMELVNRGARESHDGQFGGEFYHRKNSGEVFPVLLSRSLVRRTSQNGELQDVAVVVARDITDRKRGEEALKESEERYAVAVHGANDGLWDWNLKTNEIYYSPRWKSMLGWEADSVGNSPLEWFSRVHPDDLKRLQMDIAAHLKGTTTHFENEHRMLHRDGSYKWMLSRGLAVRDGADSAYRMAGSQSDITKRRIAEEQLIHHAFHDGLTGLPNRSLFMDRLERALERARRRRDYAFAVIFLDLDRFKIINDSLGHMAGDQLLFGIAQRLKQALRPSDTVARLGGDEFAVLLDDIKEPSDSSIVADRIQKALTLPFDMSGQEVFTTASIGIALSSSEYERPEDFLRDADTAMYRAKAHGRARHETFDTGMHDKALALLHLETDLWKALERQEFEIYYQPVVSLKTGRVVGAEALLRWNHPHRGLVSPVEFIPLAEETGLIVSIGEWVLRQACRQSRQWHNAGYSHLRIMVNVSARQFQHQYLPEVVRKVLDESQLPPRAIALEITETTAMRNIDLTIETLKELRRMGIKISIDDFGTGYSSLGCLKHFPITTIKLDRSFVSGTTAEAQEEAAIARAIIQMAHSLHMEIVAEGVEQPAEMEFLRSEGCDSMQGYIFSRPLPVHAFTQLLEDGKCLPWAEPQQAQNPEPVS